MVGQGATDLRAAALDLAADPPILDDLVFHCQQAVEKAMKAFLSWHDEPFGKTHNLETLGEGAKRFEEGGVAPADLALNSLKRCKPGRPPIYRDGDLYALDPHDAETDLWAFRLGLRPPKTAALPAVRHDPGTLPSPDQP